MLWFLLLATSVQASVIGPIVPQLDGRIVGGYDTTIERRPYQLSLQSYGSHSCGASIIKTNTAITAAHCTNGQTPSALSIRAGTTYRGYAGQVVPVRVICEHSAYNPILIDNDVSVLLLSYDIQLSSKAQPISLQPLNQELPVGAYGVVSGWGAIYEGGMTSKTLKEVSVVHLSDSQCASAYGANKVTPRMICFGFENGGRDSCQGDSGGPLVSNKALVGIVSWGYGCARPQYPGVYAKVSNTAIRFHIDKCMA